MDVALSATLAGSRDQRNPTRVPFTSSPVAQLSTNTGTRTRQDPADAARGAGLRYVSADEPGISRQKSGKGFTYRTAEGATIKERRVRRRIESLVIPPAWTDVWICEDPEGHLQATGRDDRGRKQYRYHPRFREAQDVAKFSRLAMFGLSLPRIRARVERDLAQDGLPYSRVLAAAVRILRSEEHTSELQ